MNFKLASFPRVIRIEPASLCNLRCRHCPTGTVEMKRGIMGDDIFSLVLNNIEENLDYIKVAVIYHGGEPLLNKNLIDMVNKIKELGVPFTRIVSNGMLLNDKNINDIVTSQLDEFQISLDGVSPEQNNFIRQNCDFDKVKNNIKKLINAKKEANSQLEITLSSTQFAKTAEEAEKNKIKFPQYLNEAFNEEITSGEIKTRAFYAIQWPHMEVDEKIMSLIPVKNKDIQPGYCDHVYNTMTVRWNGDVVPCCYDLLSDMVMGNIKNQSLKDIWQSEGYNKIRKDIKEGDLPDLCQKCFTITDSHLLKLK